MPTSYKRVPTGFLVSVGFTWLLKWGIPVQECLSELPLPLNNPVCLLVMTILLKPLLVTYVRLILMRFAYPAKYVLLLAALLLFARTGSSWSPLSHIGPWETS